MVSASTTGQPGWTSTLYAGWARLESLPAASAREAQEDEQRVRQTLEAVEQECRQRTDEARRAQTTLREKLARAHQAARQRAVLPGRPTATRRADPDFTGVDRLCVELDHLAAVRSGVSQEVEAARARLRAVEAELAAARQWAEALAKGRARDRLVLAVTGAVAVAGFLLGTSVLGVLLVVSGAGFVAQHLYRGLSAVVMRGSQRGGEPLRSPTAPEQRRRAWAALGGGVCGVALLLAAAASPDRCVPFGACAPAIAPWNPADTPALLAPSGWGSFLWWLAFLPAAALLLSGVSRLANERRGATGGR